MAALPCYGCGVEDELKDQRNDIEDTDAALVGGNPARCGVTIGRSRFGDHTLFAIVI